MSFNGNSSYPASPHPQSTNYLLKGCFYCRKQINIQSELFYTFGKEDKPKKKTRIYFVCPGCMEEVAGKELL